MEFPVNAAVTSQRADQDDSKKEDNDKNRDRVVGARGQTERQQMHGHLDELTA